MRIRNGIIGAVMLFLASAVQTFAVVDQALTVQGTNLVLSWPSLGNEYYMIQYRPTLDPSTPWVQLTNAYPANSTNRTTFTIPCCTLAALAGGAGSLASSAPLALSGVSESDAGDSINLWAMGTNGAGTAVPLYLYPPGYDTNRLFIFEAPMPQAQAQA